MNKPQEQMAALLEVNQANAHWQKCFGDFLEGVCEKAARNVAKWGVQDAKTLALAIAEECGEIAQAVLRHKHEWQDAERIQEECQDLAPLCFQLWLAVHEQLEAEATKRREERDAHERLVTDQRGRLQNALE